VGAVIALSGRRRWLLGLVACGLALYVAENLYMVIFVCQLVRHVKIEYRVADAASGAPVSAARIRHAGLLDREEHLLTGPGGIAREEVVWAGTLFWHVPLCGRIAVQDLVRVAADGYVEQEVQLGPQLEGMSFRDPQGVVTVRLQRAGSR
jgi:hypothetical protein